jgi:hypothetical protein
VPLISGQIAPIRQKYEEVLDESDAECMAFWQRTAPVLTLSRGVEHQDGPSNQILGGKISVAKLEFRALSANMGELSLGVCPGDAQMGSTGQATRRGDLVCGAMADTW